MEVTLAMFSLQQGAQFIVCYYICDTFKDAVKILCYIWQQFMIQNALIKHIIS